MLLKRELRRKNKEELKKKQHARPRDWKKRLRQDKPRSVKRLKQKQRDRLRKLQKEQQRKKQLMLRQENKETQPNNKVPNKMRAVKENPAQVNPKLRKRQNNQEAQVIIQHQITGLYQASTPRVECLFFQVILIQEREFHLFGFCSTCHLEYSMEKILKINT